jgi:uncharacterized protein (TIGR02246 family)
MRHLALLVLTTALTTACAAPAPAPPAEPPDTRAADEAAIRAVNKEWQAAAQAKDAAKFTSFYADDATLMLEDSPDFRTPSVIRENLGGMFQDPNFALSFAEDKITVARSGDIAYDTGSYALTVTGPDKKPTTENGHYVVVWQKGADGTWKVAIDAPISDPTPAPAAKP